MILYGLHTCLSALQNPKRQIRKLYLTASILEKYGKHYASHPHTILSHQQLTHKCLTEDHQGIALDAEPLPYVFLEDILNKNGLLLFLDEIMDPHNLGAIIRSAACFSSLGVVVTKKHTAPLTSTVAKVASGALEHVPLITISNLSQGLREAQKEGFWCLGCDERGDQLGSLPKKTAFVLGSEGKGLRSLTKKTCDALVSVKTSPNFSTLNVSNTAAIVLHQYYAPQ